LIKHGVHLFLMARAGFEGGKVLEVRKGREHDLSADGREHEFGHYQPEVLYRPRATRTAVTHKAGRFVVPFAIDKVDSVFERTGDAVVVL
jgi:hypothetical protein